MKNGNDDISDELTLSTVGYDRIALLHSSTLSIPSHFFYLKQMLTTASAPGIFAIALQIIQDKWSLSSWPFGSIS